MPTFREGSGKHGAAAPAENEPESTEKFHRELPEHEYSPEPKQNASPARVLQYSIPVKREMYFQAMPAIREDNEFA